MCHSSSPGSILDRSRGGLLAVINRQVASRRLGAAGSLRRQELARREQLTAGRMLGPPRGRGLEREKAVSDRAVRTAFSSVILAPGIPDNRVP